LTQTSRAVQRTIEPGSSAICPQCGLIVKFQARTQGKQVICNVYDDGVWKRVEHFHLECYDDAGQPFGEATISETPRRGA